MATDKPGGWRGKTPQAPGARPGRQKGAGWAQRPEQPAAVARRWHRLKVASWLLVAASLVAGFLVYLMFRPIRPPLIVAVAPDYAFPLPPNAYAREDHQRLVRLDEREVVALRQAAWQSTEQGLALLRDQLDAARPGGPGKDVVIVYLSMHGFVDGRGEPCLVPPGAAAADSRAWLPVRELLETLFVKERAGRTAPGVTRLLVLDAARVQGCWSVGVLHNDFAQRLQRVVEELKVPGLAVLGSAGVGQAGHCSPELGASVFNYYFVRGLEGEADAAHGDADGKVSLQELHRHLAAQVGQWTVENRGDFQAPVLIPADADIQLAYARSSGPADIGELPAPDPRWNEVAALWGRHAALLATKPYRRDPLGWEEFQHKLLRLEQLVMAGAAYEGQFRQTKAELGALTDALSAAAAPRRLPAHSLALAARFGQWSPAEADPKKVPGPWQAPANDPGESDATAKPQAKSDASPSESAEKPAEKPKSQAKPQAKEAPPKVAYLPAAAAVWQWCKEQPTKDRVDRAAEFLRTAQGRPKADVAEVRFLRMMGTHLDWDSGAPARLGQALAVRETAEQAAAPPDARAQHLLRATVDAADAKRRLAEDKLLVGTDAALAEAEAAWTEALSGQSEDSGYRAAVRTAERAAAAFALRDRAWAEAPYVAQWLLARARRDAKSPAEDLPGLVAGAHALSAELEKSVAAGTPTRELDAAQARLETRLAGLEKAVADESYRLRVTAGEDQHTLRAIGDLLSVPLVTGEDRARLREKYLRIARTRSAATAGAAAGSGKAAPAAAAAEGEARVAKLLDKWGEHPALALLGRRGTEEGADAGPKPGPPSAQGEAVRALLASVRAEAVRLMDRTEKAIRADEQSPQAPAAVRAGRSEADSLVRAAAPLLGRRLWDDPRSDPARRLEELDAYELLVWHAHRAMDDFAGPAAEGDPPSFQVVAEDYLGAARALGGRGAPLRYGPTSLPARLAARSRAAAAGLRPRADDLLVSADDAFFPHKAAVAVPADLPEGVAAFGVAMPGGKGLALRPGDPKQPALSRLELPTQPARDASLAYAVGGRPELFETRTLRADVLFRGHAWPATFYVQPAAGLDVVYERPDYGPPSVTVFGQARQQVSVAFILDCSGSMMRRLGGDEKNPRRMEIAREALQAILVRLVGPDNPFRVGVIAYGHRCGWNPEEGKHDEMVVPDPADPQRFVPAPPDFNLHPSADVETIHRIGDFNKKVQLEVSAKLDGLRPAGETPLFLSILQGIDAVRGEPKENRRHVVVLTDGFNEQSGGPAEARKFPKDVHDSLALPSNRGVQLDIVGFEAVAHTDEEKRSLKDLVDVAEKTGGAFHPANDPSALLRAFEKSLGLVQYVVEPLPGERGGKAGPAELGQPVVVEQPPQRKAGYRVRLVDTERPAEAQVELEGGEAVQLWLVTDRGRRRLVHRRFDRDLRADAENVAAPGDSGRAFYVGAHLPEWEGRAVRFRVSVQNGAGEEFFPRPAERWVLQPFSPRPAEAWMEVTPLLPEGKTAPPYIFYDVAFDPERPVPVLTCLARNWPPEARLAQVRLWFRMSATPPDLAVALAQLARESPVLEDAPDVRFAVETREPEKPDEPFQVVIVERHPEGSRLDAVKVEMSPPSARVLHRYQPQIGTVRHVFSYPDALAGEVGSYRVLLTARKRLTEKAAALPEPLPVAVPRTAVAPGG